MTLLDVSGIIPRRSYKTGALIKTAGALMDKGNAHYASGAGDKRTDFSLRRSTTRGIWDVGLAHFSGTSREPHCDEQRCSLNCYDERDDVAPDRRFLPAGTVGAGDK